MNIENIKVSHCNATLTGYVNLFIAHYFGVVIVLFKLGLLKDKLKFYANKITGNYIKINYVGLHFQRTRRKICRSSYRRHNNSSEICPHMKNKNKVVLRSEKIENALILGYHDCGSMSRSITSTNANVVYFDSPFLKSV